jgi:phosphoribosylformimino-5-aminoimidazole carboxamide ribotide isomerase
VEAVMPEIRIAGQQDIELLFEIRTSVAQNHQSRDELAKLGVTPAAVGDALKAKSRAWIASVDETPAAFAMADSGEATVFAMFVRPEFENRGLGRLLMAEAERFLFQNHRRIWLTTGTGRQIRANGFYKWLGWSATEVMDDGQTRYEKTRSPILFPAIDLKDGQCVRLKLGEMASATVYNDDPAAQAKAFEDQGFKWLHVVDLNGAFEGRSVNGDAVDSILAATKNPVQLGGGIRTLAHIEGWLDKGLARVILGTVAVRNPDLVKEACRLFPGKIAVGIDAKGGKVAVEGWGEASELGVIELAQKFEGAGVSAIVYTDIDRDGILAGINWDSTLELARAVSIPVIASGGLASLDDIRKLASPECAVLEGAISGRALYDGRIDAEEALSILRASKAA